MAGDSEYHLRMTEAEIRSLLDGSAKSIRLPPRFGLPHETRFLLVNNVLEVTVADLILPDEPFIAEGRQ